MVVYKFGDRKISKAGLRGMILRLPNEWLRLNKVKPGDSADITSRDDAPGELIIRLKRKPTLVSK